MSDKTPIAVLRLNSADNVVIARWRLETGSDLASEKVITRQEIAAGHKVAAQDIPSGSPVRRYGQIIGFASTDIKAGDHVHTHNLSMGEFERDMAFGADAKPTVMADTPATFQGILRADGRVATRNFIGIITSVNCSATVARYAADAFRKNPFAFADVPDPMADFPNVDGVVALTHKAGCGMAPDGDGLAVLRRTIAGYSKHPNFSHVLMIGLGCESNQVDEMVQLHGLKTIRVSMPTYTIQNEGGSRKTIERAIAQIKEFLPDANRVKRQAVSAVHLTVALQCGGSDSYSGVTANPALGSAADRLVSHGASVILGETPETYGAEHLLTRRAQTPEVGEKFMRKIAWWKQYTEKNGGDMDNNPSPGNKKGGLTTILEKSLGAVAKAGTTNLVDVLDYAQARGKAPGFYFMDTPGYDPVSVTGQVAGGANLVCFTTGRGSVFGAVPAPSLKLATNSDLYKRMPEDMDIDCGGIIEGRESVQECGARIFDKILATASGERSQSEKQGFGESEFAPWPLGAVM